MPRRFFTFGRKFSTTTSAFLTSRLNAASPCGDFKLMVMLRLLRWRFMKSELSRGPPIGSSESGGASTLMTLAPQSASSRTQVGPARTRVRSSTVKRASAFDARGLGTANAPIHGDVRIGQNFLHPAGVVHRGGITRKPYLAVVAIFRAFS